MTKEDWRSRILTRRAGFLALAVAAGGAAAPGCKDKPEVVEIEAMTCLSVAGGRKPRGEEGSIVPQETSFKIQRGNETLLDGRIAVTTLGNVRVVSASRLCSSLLAQTKPCILESIGKGDDPSGTFDVEFGVGPDGRVTDAKVTGPGGISETLGDCVVLKSRELIFPVENATERSVTAMRWSLKKP
jgi:hypothetical protein